MRSINALLLFCMSLLAGVAQATPAIQHWTTSNGARVYFVPAPELPMVDIRVLFDAGAARDGDTPGLAQFTNAMIPEGAGELDTDAIAERFDAVGAQFEIDSLRDMGLLSLRSLTDPELLDPAVETFALLLRQPNFPQGALERERKRLLTGLRYEQQEPSEIASRAFYSAMYGGHPYAIAPSGDEASITAITQEQIRAFYQRYYVGANAVVALVGDLDRAGAESLAERLVGGLPKGEAAPVLPTAEAPAQGVTLRKQHSASQTHILMGLPVLTRDDPDYFALYVGNHILGGNGLISRISDTIREQRGLAYSAYSYFVPMRAAGPLILGLQTKNATADEALGLLQRTLATFIAEGPSAAELQAAKDNITGGFPLVLDSNKDIVGYLGMIGFYGLPLDYIDTLPGKVEAVTLAQVRDAWTRRIDPARMVTVLVGGGQGEGE